MKTVQIRATLLGAAFLVVAGPALADTFPGTMCRSAGITYEAWSGLVVNKVVGTGTTAFVCPLPHARYGINAYTQPLTPLTIKVNYKTSNYTGTSNSIKFECFVRTVAANNQAYDAITLTGFSTASVGPYHSIEGQIYPPGYGSAAMTCYLPNIYAGGGEAGIVSYTVY